MFGIKKEVNFLERVLKDRVDDFIKNMNVRFTYKNIKGYKLTIASIMQPIKSEKYKDSLYRFKYVCGISYCSPKDEFNKEKGRMLAIERLVNRIYNDHVFLLVPEERCHRFLKNDVIWTYILLDNLDDIVLKKIIEERSDVIKGLALLDLMVYRIKKVYG